MYESNFIKGKNMIERICRILLISLILSGFVVLLYGCATIPKEADINESLRSEALHYWKMRIEGKYEDTFKMEEKERLIKRNTEGLPLNEFYKAKAMVTGPITSYSIKDVRILDGKGKVNVQFTLTLPEIPRPVSQILTDEWILENGKWLHLFH